VPPPALRRKIPTAITARCFGGDEINLILPGKNYGWPTISYGRDYAGPRISDVPWKEGFEQPLVTWIPSIALSGMTFYSGNRFPNWKGNVFVGGMRYGEIQGTGRLERVVFNEEWKTFAASRCCWT